MIKTQKKYTITVVVNKEEKVFLAADYIPRVSNDTREENHRQPTLTRLTKVWRGRGERRCQPPGADIGQ